MRPSHRVCTPVLYSRPLQNVYRTQINMLGVSFRARARAAPTGATRGLTSGAQCRHHSSTNWIFALSVSMSSKSAIIRSSSKSSSWMTMANR